MITYTSLEQVPANHPASVVAVGKFDGIHVGHQAMLRQLIDRSRALGCRAVVLTFPRHPLHLLDPAACPESLMSTEQRLEALAQLGVDAVVMVPFDHTFAALSPEAFCTDVLRDRVAVREVLVGEDFRYGSGGGGNVETLAMSGTALGFTVHVVGDVVFPQAGEQLRKVSSSMIRGLLEVGDVAAAARALGQEHRVRGEVVHGAKRGRELGFPTANLPEVPAGFVPADGVYAAWLHWGERRFPAAVSIGTNPTFHDVTRRQIEAHVIDHTLDLYGQVVEVAFVERLRGMVAYTTLPALIEQMHADVQRCRVVLGAAGEDAPAAVLGDA